jgi:hypothetical protein
MDFNLTPTQRVGIIKWDIVSSKPTNLLQETLDDIFLCPYADLNCLCNVGRVKFKSHDLTHYKTWRERGISINSNNRTTLVFLGSAQGLFLNEAQFRPAEMNETFCRSLVSEPWTACRIALPWRDSRACQREREKHCTLTSTDHTQRRLRWWGEGIGMLRTT